MTAEGAGLSERDRLVRVVYLALTGDKWESWSQGLVDGAMAENVASMILAAGFGDVAAMEAERDATGLDCIECLGDGVIHAVFSNGPVDLHCDDCNGTGVTR